MRVAGNSTNYSFSMDGIKEFWRNIGVHAIIQLINFKKRQNEKIIKILLYFYYFHDAASMREKIHAIAIAYSF